MSIIAKIKSFLGLGVEYDDAYQQFSAYSTMVSKLKIIVGFAAAFLIIMIIVFPLLDDNRQGIKVIPKDGVSDNDKPSMEKPRLHGTDANNQPYNITAERAVQEDAKNMTLYKIEGDIHLKDGAWISLLSDSGKYSVSSRTLDLSGSINLFMDNGYEFLTETARVDLKQSIATGNDKVFVQGPLGKLQSQGFVIKNNGDDMEFTGGVHLVIFPGGDL